MWEWLEPRKIVQTSPHDDQVREGVVIVSDTITRIGRSPTPRFPEFVVAVDVETTGLHSTDRIVSIGAIWLPTACLSEPSFPISYIHLIFDPGRTSHPKAEEVHGFDDWTLRHQEPFGLYAERIRRFLQSGNLIIAHNAEFDIGFINRELATAGQPTLDKPICCTTEGYRAADLGASASLKSVCATMGLRRQGKVHGALEDAWLALMAYLWLHDYEHCKPFIACGQHLELFNLLPAPPRPEGALPRRSRKHSAGE